MKRVLYFAFLFGILIYFNLYAQEEETILMSSGESKTITFSEKIKKVAIGDPEVADVNTVSSYELLINAKNEGSTSLILWVGKEKSTRKIIVTKVDVSAVLSEIKTMLKGVKGISVNLRSGSVVLEGEIENEKDAVIIQNIVDKYKGQIKNFVKLPVQMIKINARIVEMGTTDDSSIGIDWQKKFQFVENTVEGIYQIGKISRTTKVDAMLDFLANEGSAKIVARPNIIVINGKLATFHSGGKILIPVSSQGDVSVEEKSYGVDLQILPFGDRKSGLVRSKVKIEVSTLDWANAVKYSEGTIPSIRDRRIETEIDVKVGTTIVIAGLLMEEDQEYKKKVPILGSIPLLGLLFSSTEIRKSKTELVIFLTPSFVNYLGEEIIE